MTAAIEVHGLTKQYAGTTVVRDISFTVEHGEIFGIIGPNGAGKTTTVECIEGLRRPDAGRISVPGLSPGPDRHELRERLGIQLQDAELPERLRVGEALRMYSPFCTAPADWRALMEMLGLTGKEKTQFGKLSGGQRQRLSVALALVGRPEVMMLDELTTGLDPSARREVRSVQTAQRPGHGDRTGDVLNAVGCCWRRCSRPAAAPTPRGRSCSSR